MPEETLPPTDLTGLGPQVIITLEEDGSASAVRTTGPDGASLAYVGVHSTQEVETAQRLAKKKGTTVEEELAVFAWGI